MMSYNVLVYDNNRYGDESERIDCGVFATAEEAIAKSGIKIIDDDLKWMWKPGMSAADLCRLLSYVGGPIRSSCRSIQATQS